MNYVLLTGPQEGPHTLEGFYDDEASLRAAVEKAEERGEFCVAYPLTNPCYTTEG